MGYGTAVLNIATAALSPTTHATGPPPKPREQYEREKAERLEREANRPPGPRRKRSKIKESLFLPKEQQRSWRGYPDAKGGSTKAHKVPLGLGGATGAGGFDGGFGDGGDGGDCGGGE